MKTANSLFCAPATVSGESQNLRIVCQRHERVTAPGKPAHEKPMNSPPTTLSKSLAAMSAQTDHVSECSQERAITLTGRVTPVVLEDTNCDGFELAVRVRSVATSRVGRGVGLRLLIGHLAVKLVNLALNSLEFV